MKPGIPWSVKGIEQQARAAAKQAARQSGMTIGEWLNSVILESAEGGDDLERRYRRPAYRPKPLPGSDQEHGEGVTLRLEEIAEQLHTIARQESDTAVARQTSPEDEAALRAIVERLDAYEQQTSSALGVMQEKLDDVAERLWRLPAHEAAGHQGAGAKLPQRAADVPGYQALEEALRHVIEHIELSETRTRDTIKSLQDRLAETTGRSGGEPTDAVALANLEQRVAELAERMTAADASEPNDMAEVREAEQRLRSAVEEAKELSGTVGSDPAVAQLRLDLEQLAATVSQGSGHAIAELNERVQHVEAALKSQFIGRDEETLRQVASLGERLAATEQRLEHLATIEQSVAQLAQSLEASRTETAPGEGSGQPSGASPELKALEDGLKAVRASAAVADRRTQETLKAVHETLEQIVDRLAELEADDEPDGKASDHEPSSKLAEQPDAEAAEAPVEQAAEDSARDAAMPDGESGVTPDPEEARRGEDESDDKTAAGAENEAADLTGEATPAEPVTGDALSGDSESATPQAQFQAHHAPANDAGGHSEPAGAPIREDYIAAARRAAQMAARDQRSLASGFNKFSRRMSGADAQPAKPTDRSPPRRGLAAKLFGRGRAAKSADTPQPDAKLPPDAKTTKRKRLIFAGLVLLVAVSAYAAHRHAGSIPNFNLLGGTLFDPLATPAETEAPRATQTPRDTPPAGSTTRHSPAAASPPDAGAVASQAATVETLSQQIGPESLRQAAVDGDAVAQFVVAMRYLEGKAVARDEERAAYWYAKAAEQGLAAAQYRLGSMYEHGRGMPADLQLARMWYERAAESGNVTAMHNLAVLYVEAGAGQQYQLAASWFTKAAERGLKDSQFNLALLHEQGLGLPRNRQHAMFWYSLAAAQGDQEAALKAKELGSALSADAAKWVEARLAAWRPLPVDREANLVPDGDPSWQELS
jgi:localization factor PodJL